VIFFKVMVFGDCSVLATKAVTFYI